MSIEERPLTEGFGEGLVKLEGVLDPKTGDVTITLGGVPFTGMLVGRREGNTAEVTMATSGDRHEVLRLLTVILKAGIPPFDIVFNNLRLLKTAEPLVALKVLDRNEFIESLGLKGSCPCPECNPPGEPPKNTGKTPEELLVEAARKALSRGATPPPDSEADKVYQEAAKMGMSPSKGVH